MLNQVYLQASALAVVLIPLSIISFKTFERLAGAWKDSEEKGEGGRGESVAFPKSKGNISPSPPPAHRYLQKLLPGSPSLCIPALKTITPAVLGISPKLAPGQGRRSMLFNIKLFTTMTFIMLMAKSHWLWKSQNEAISKGLWQPQPATHELCSGSQMDIFNIFLIVCLC